MCVGLGLRRRLSCRAAACVWRSRAGQSRISRTPWLWIGLCDLIAGAAQVLCATLCAAGCLPASLPVMMLCLSLVRRWPVGQCCTEATPNSERLWSSGERQALVPGGLSSGAHCLACSLCTHSAHLRLSTKIDSRLFARRSISARSAPCGPLSCDACLHTYSARMAVSKLFGMHRAVQAPTEMQSSRPA